MLDLNGIQAHWHMVQHAPMQTSGPATSCGPGISNGPYPKHCSRSVGTMPYRPRYRPAEAHPPESGLHKPYQFYLFHTPCRASCCFSVQPGTSARLPLSMTL